MGFKNNLDSHKITPANSTLTIIPIFIDSGIETRYTNEILKEMAAFRLMNQNMFKNHIFLSASFYKNIEKDQTSDEIEINSNLNFI